MLNGIPAFYDAKRAEKPGYVYMFSNDEQSVYIGRTDSIENKLRKLRRFFNKRVTVLWYAFVNNMDNAETYIKDLYSDMAIKNEIFDYNGQACFFAPRYDIRSELDILIRKFQ